MKKTIITFLLALVFPITASAQLESVKELTMKSEFFNHERQVLIYTPVGYQQYDQTYYDVIYVFDAQDRTNPEFKGGQKALTIFLTKNLRYPDAAADYGVEGSVVNTKKILVPLPLINDTDKSYLKIITRYEEIYSQSFDIVCSMYCTIRYIGFHISS